MYMDILLHFIVTANKMINQEWAFNQRNSVSSIIIPQPQEFFLCILGWLPKANIISNYF